MKMGNKEGNKTDQKVPNTLLLALECLIIIFSLELH